MKTTDTLRATWVKMFSARMLNGYDPYDSIGGLQLGEISISWRDCFQ